MNYHMLIWKNSSPNMPKIIIYEVGIYGYETRKLEFFDGGKIGYAYDEIEYCECEIAHPTGLSDQPSPQIDDYNQNPVFLAKAISKDYFEMAWDKFGPE
ncbi:DUF6881 domain-containing protein [Brevibacillus dissolubilis]|uniref:DUF6881 domain-containing protein n=1 Tax=Brevibacillus dissolubilis TaxID=1844116 RepID=UPI0011176F85|nr:hypothetical protein [Brevibacillus dissolubilis]